MRTFRNAQFGVLLALIPASTALAAYDAQYIVGFRANVADGDAASLLDQAGFETRDRIPELDVWIVAATDPVAEVKGLDQLRRSGRIEYTEKDEKRWHTTGHRALRLPNDPSYDQQYGLPQINAPAAWDVSTGSRNVVVAVVDSGIAWGHPDLKDQIWQNRGEIPGNMVDDDHNGFVDDILGWDFVTGDIDPNDEMFHGTHVAGIIGARTDNGVGIAGVNWNVTLMAVRSLDKDGFGTASQLMSGIVYAANNGARIINASWGSESPSPGIENAINYAYSKGVLFIAAAGNESKDFETQPFYPAGYAGLNVMSVAASRQGSDKAYFSNWGRFGVDLAAPGDSIFSTWINDGYQPASGTSMATPMVAGVAALALAQAPQLSTLQLRNLLFSSVVPRSDFIGQVATDGEIDAAATLARLAGGFQVWPAKLRVAVNARLNLSTYGAAGTVAWSVSNTGIARVSAAGELDPLAPGTVTVEGRDTAGRVATSTIEIVQPTSGGGDPGGGGCQRTQNAPPYDSANRALSMGAPLLVAAGLRFVRRRRRPI